MPNCYRTIPPLSAGIGARSLFAFSPARFLRHCVALSFAASVLTIPALAQVVPTAPTTLPTQLTLPQAIIIALRHQPQQYIAKDQTSQARGQKQQAQAQYLPTLTPSYQFQNTTQTVYGLNPGSSGTVTTGTGTTGTGTTGTGTTGTGTTGTGTTFVNSGINEVSTVRGGGLTVGIDQNIYDGGAREAINAEARRALDAAYYNNANVRQNTIFTVTQDYYQLLLALDLVKVARAQVARYAETLAATQAQVQAGTTAKKEILQAQADLANAQVMLLQDQNQVTTASAALKNALGVNTNTVVQPAPLAAGDKLPPLPAAGPDMTLDTALATAYTSRPDLSQQRAIVESDNAALSQAKRQAGFTVSSDYVLTYQATNDTGTRGATSQLLVTGSYPLFDAGNARGAVRIAQAQKDQAQNQLEVIRQQIHEDVEQAYATRAVNLQAAQFAQAAVAAANENYDAALGSQQAGVGTILDVITAQATLQQAQNQFVTAVYNFYIADAQLVRAIGRNDAPYTATP